MITDRRAFIVENTRLQAPPHAPELTLHLADEITPIWKMTEEDLAEIGLPPPFWAFAWAGGQALARHVLDHPDIVAGKRVIDFATGSGLVAIAAMKAGEFANEITPVEVTDRAPDLASGDVVSTTRTVNIDEGARPDTTVEGLARLRAVFAARGSVTAQEQQLEARLRQARITLAGEVRDAYWAWGLALAERDAA